MSETEIKPPAPASPSISERAAQGVRDQLRYAQANLDWLSANGAWIDEVGIVPHFSGQSVFFWNPKREQVLTIIKAVGGKWDKSYNESTIHYTQSFPDGFTIHLRDSQPPGTCRLIPVKTIVPAHWQEETVVEGFKLQCRETSATEGADAAEPEVAP